MISKKLLLVFVGLFAVLIFANSASSFLKLDDVSCKHATNVSATNNHSCVLKENGNADCEGDSNWPGLESDYEGSNGEEISMERNIRCIRKTNGNVSCNSTWYSIGGFTTGDAQEVSVGTDRDSSHTFTCIVRSGGGLKCKSSSGSGTSDVESIGGNVEQLSVDDSEACVLNNNGNVNCSHSTSGNFNNPVAQNPEYTGGNAEQVAFSEDSTLNSNDADAYVVTRCILKSSGNVDCIGNSTYYGNEHVQDYNKGDAKKVVVDGFQTCVLKDNSNGNGGNVECWGSDRYKENSSTVGTIDLEKISFKYEGRDAVDVSIGGLSNYICVAKENGDTSCNKVGSGFDGTYGGSPADNGKDFNHSCVDPIDRVSESDWAQSGRNGSNNRYAENLSHVDKGIEEKAKNYINSLGQPVLYDGYVYGVSREHGLYKLDASNFSKGVLTNYTGVSKGGTPAVIEKSVYAINYSGSTVTLYRFDLGNFTNPINTVSFTSAEPRYEPTVSENYVYVSTNGSSASNHLYQFNRSNINQQISTFSASGGLSGPATINKNYVYVGGEGGNIYQLDKADISNQISSHSFSSSGYTGIPALSGQKIYINEFSQGIYSVNSSDVSQGVSVSGSLSARPSSEIATNEEFVYVVDNNDNLNQLNSSDISQKISTFTSGYSLSDPSATDDHVYITDATETLYQLNASNISDTESTMSNLGNFSPVLSSDFAYIRSVPTDGVNYNATLYKISGSCNPPASGIWVLDSVNCFFNNALDIGAREMVMKNSANVTLNSSSVLRASRIVVRDSAGIFRIL